MFWVLGVFMGFGFLWCLGFVEYLFVFLYACKISFSVMLLWLTLSAAKHKQKLIFGTRNLSVAPHTVLVTFSSTEVIAVKLRKLFVVYTQTHRM